jgi:hypothetical protein
MNGLGLLPGGHPSNYFFLFFFILSAFLFCKNFLAAIRIMQYITAHTKLGVLHLQAQFEK